VSAKGDGELDEREEEDRKDDRGAERRGMQETRKRNAKRVSIRTASMEFLRDRYHETTGTRKSKGSWK